MTILRDRVDAGSQDMGIERERGDTHEGTAVGRRAATDEGMDKANNMPGSSGRS